MSKKYSIIRPFLTGIIFLFTSMFYGLSGQVIWNEAQIIPTVEPHNLTYGDFDNDGDDDILVRNYNDASMIMMLNDGNGSFLVFDTIITYGFPRPSVVTDFNNDGNLDFAQTHSSGTNSGDEITVHLGNGDGTFQDYDLYNNLYGNYTYYIDAGDINGDSFVDLVFTSAGSPDGFAILINNGDGTFTSGASYPAGTETGRIKLVDINNNGKLDAVIGCGAYGSGYQLDVYYGNGDATFSNRETYPSPIASERIELFDTADLDADGDIDLIIDVLKTGDRNLYIMRNDGTGIFSYEFIETGGWIFASAIDWDNDGDIDILDNKYDDNSGLYVETAVFINDGLGDFSEKIILNENHVRYYVPSDLNNDGLIDIAGCNYTHDSVYVYLQEEEDVQRNALIALYNATDGDNWINNTNWLSEEPLGDWYGVTTDVDGNVIRLQLTTNNLVGMIPPEIEDLSELEVLQLGQNTIIGSIPVELCSLLQLYDLRINNNQLNGNIPNEIGNLTSLKTLYLEFNNLTGAIPSSIGSLVVLESLMINSNQLTGALPEELGNIPTLLTLYVNNNGLSGEVPESLGNLSNLYALFLSTNSFTGTFPANIANIPSLNTLFVKLNHFDSIPEVYNTFICDNINFNENDLTYEELNNLPNNSSFSPQNTIHAYDTAYLTAGQAGNIQLSFDNEVENSTYKWYRDNNLIGTSLENSIAVTEDNAGTFYYNLEITNTDFPGFTLEVDSVVVIVEENNSDEIIFITVEGAGLEDGSSWENAMDSTKVQYAINLQKDNDGGQVWIAKGIYHPTDTIYGTQTSGLSGQDSLRMRGFSFHSKVEVYGGFTGNETSIEERNIENNKTILSGDFSRNDEWLNEWAEGSSQGNLLDALQIALPDTALLPDTLLMNENAMHVGFIPPGTDSTCILNGLVFANGYARLETQDINGGGLFSSETSSPTVDSCVFVANVAVDGGGAFVYDGQFTNSEFRNNATFRIEEELNPLDGYGAGLYSAGGQFDDCLFSSNKAISKGGGLYSIGGSFDNCDILFNRTDDLGAGVYVENGGSFHDSEIAYNKTAPTGNCAGGGVSTIKNGYFYQCLIHDNETSEDVNSTGGGIYMGEFNYAVNCKIFNNKSKYGGGVSSMISGFFIGCAIYNNEAQYGGGYNSNSHGFVINSSIVNNISSIDAGGLLINSKSMIKNSLIWNNNSSGTSNQLKGNNVFGNKPSLYSNAIQDTVIGNFSGNSSFYIDSLNLGNEQGKKYAGLLSPISFVGRSQTEEQFQELLNADFSISALSSCINNGTTDSQVADVDLNGNPRMVGDTLDIGACEYQGDFEFFTPQTEIQLTNLAFGDIAWGDYDNDNDLDILITGSDATSTTVTKVFKNNADNSFTEQTGITITGFDSSSAEWGDYDNDGYLDILLTGSSGTSKIYLNNGDNSFTEQATVSLTGVYQGDATWGDYNNDGLLDILLTGTDDSGQANPIAKIYKNNGDFTFAEQANIILAPVRYSAVDWGDYDKDGDLDILLIGLGDNGEITKVYKNNGDESFSELNNNLTGFSHGDAIWGDYDNDGDLDILLSGANSGFNAKIYQNIGNDIFVELTDFAAPELYYGSAAWGDYNNDGLLDFIINGITGGNIKQTKLYKNIGNNDFEEEIEASFVNLDRAALAWADYDNDGDLDILMTGQDENYNETSILYTNNSTIENTAPSVPTGLTAQIENDSVFFQWNRANDNETAALGLSYNIRVGSLLDEIDLRSPQSSIYTGFHRIAQRGMIQDTAWFMKLPESILLGDTVFWSVQAIDHGLLASEFSGIYNVVNEEDNPMVIHINTNHSEGTTMELPLFGEVDVTVNWGDGTIEDFNSEGLKSHTYTEENQFSISISGSLEQFGNGQDSYLGVEKVDSVSSFGDLGLISLSGAFNGAEYLVLVPNVLPESITDLGHTFRNAIIFNQNINSWDVSNVTNMYYMFMYCHAFNQPLNNWDVSNVTYMWYMFYEAISFNQDINSWDVGNVNGMASMFAFAENFNQDLNNWDVSSVNSMESMFRVSTAFNGDISNWDLSNVTNTSKMFQHATSFNQDISSWNTSNIQYMNSMFLGADSFNQDIGNWDVSNVLEMKSMFSNADLFNQDIGNWDVSSVSTMNGMFSWANQFNQDISSWNVINVADMSTMFSQNTSFNQDISSWDVSNVSQMNSMFRGAFNFNQDLSNWQVGNVENMLNMFEGLTLSTENYNAILTSWSQQGVQDNVPFHGGNSIYSCGIPAEARQSLIDNHGWTISDGGMEEGVFFTFETSDILCYGQSTGAIEITATGGTAAYEYSIDNGLNYQTSNLFTDLTAGTYPVMVKDAHNCIANHDVIISEPAAGLSFTESTTDILCFGEATGTIEITAAGGTAEYEYSIDNGESFQTENIFDNLTAGEYAIVVRDANNCETSETISINQPDAELSFTTTLTDVSCYGSATGAIEITATGGTVEYEYSIDNGESFQAENIFDNLTAGEYAIVVRDANLCLSYDLITLMEPEELFFNANLTHITCFGGNDGIIEIMVSGGTPGYEYSIDGGLNYFSNNIFTDLTAGIYDIYVMDVNECIENQQVELIEPESLPEVVFTGLSSDYCINESPVVLTGNQAPEGSFSGLGITDNGDGTAIFDPQMAGVGGAYDITYTYSDLNGCSNSNVQQTSVFDTTVVNIIGLEDSYCENHLPVIIEGSETPEGVFSGPGITDNGNGTALFDPQIAGVGTNLEILYLYTNANGCTSEKIQSVDIFEVIDVSFTTLAENICENGDVVELTGSEAPEGVFAGSGIIDHGDGTALFDPKLAGIGGPYTISYTYNSSQECQSEAIQMVNVIEYTILGIEGLEVEYCDLDQEFLLTGSESPQGIFIGPGIDNNGDGTAYFNPHEAGAGGSHEIHYIIDNTNGCNSEGIEITSVITNPIANFNFEVSGCDEAVQFSDSSVSLNGEIDIWSWSFGDGISGANNTSELQNPNHLFASNQQSFDIQLEVIDEAGCKNDTLKTIVPFETTTIVGSVISSNFQPVSSGHVRVFEYSDGIISNQVDSVPIGYGGSYIVENLSTCVDYVLHGYADQYYYPFLIPRYHYDAFYWFNADVINADWDEQLITGVNINLFEFVPPPIGNSTLEGGVYYMDSKGEPVKNVDVVLEYEAPDEKYLNPVNYVKTGENGEWKIENLPIGNNKILVDIPGLLLDSTYNVVINEPNTHISGLNYYVDTLSGIYIINTGIDELSMDCQMTLIPNPNQGYFTIQLIGQESSFDVNELDILDLRGKMILNEKINYKGKYFSKNIDFGGIESGAYFLKLHTNKGKIVRKLIIYK